MEYVSKTIDYIRKDNSDSQSISLGICILLLVFLIIIGYIIFFFNMDCKLNVIRFPVMVIYSLLFAFVLFFLLPFYF